MVAPRPGRGGQKKAFGGKGGGYVTFMVIIAVILAAVVAAFSFSMMMVLQPLGLADLMPALMMAAASVATMITTIYKVNGLLFGFRDYDMLMSLPIKTGTVITSRLMILYLYNMVFCLLLLVPSGIVYAVVAQPPAGFYPVSIICLLLIPLVPVIIATVIGTLIAFIASHFKRKSGASVILFVAFFLLWMLFCMNMETIVHNFADIGPVLMATVSRIYPLVTFYTQAVCHLDMGAFALFAGISIGAFAAFVAIVGKNFKRLNSTITANRTTSNYKMQALKQSSPRKALFQKELKRFTSSPAYMMNAGIGSILLLVGGVIILIVGAGDTMEMLGYGGMQGIAADAAPLAMTFCVGMTITTACSISLEGHSFWIIKSLPVGTKDILFSKRMLNYALIVPTVLISGVMVCIALQPALLQGLMIFLTPLAFGFFITVLGQRLNLSFPNFKWDSEVMVIKRGAPVMVCVFLTIGVAFVPFFLIAFIGPVILYAVTAGVAVAGLLIWHNLRTKGVRDFDALQA